MLVIKFSIKVTDNVDSACDTAGFNSNLTACMYMYFSIYLAWNT